jgi:hypothetical protein
MPVPAEARVSKFSVSGAPSAVMLPPSDNAKEDWMVYETARRRQVAVTATHFDIRILSIQECGEAREKAARDQMKLL